MGYGPPVDERIREIVEEGKMCGYCGEDIRTDYGLKPDDTPYGKGENLRAGAGHGTGTGEVSLCPACDAAGKDKHGYLGYLAPE